MGIGENWFPTPCIGLMKKDLAQSKVCTYFNIGDAKSLVKPIFSANFEDFFASLVLRFSQIIKLLADIVTIAYSLLE